MKKILLVEDEGTIVELVRMALESRGHTVVSAADGDDAIKLSSESIEPIDLLLCDLILPGMAAPEVVRLVRSRHPAVRVVIITGYPLEYLSDHHIDGEFCLLQKPFNVLRLSECVTCMEEVQSCGRSRKAPQSDEGIERTKALGRAC